MSDEFNPYQSPETDAAPAVKPTLTFGEAVRRGFAAAHGAPAGAVWTFVLMAPMQVIGGAMNAAMFSGDFFEQMQSGEFESTGGQPPPELITMVGAGCFMCLWMPIMFFTMPWIWGGVMGQVRDQIVGREPASFGMHGKTFYGAMLLVMLLVVVGTIAANVPGTIVGQVVTSSEIQPGQPITAEQMRALSRHPANIIANCFSGLLMALVGTLANFIIAALVARGRGIGDGLSHGFTFCSKNMGAFIKVYFIYVALFLPFAILQWIPQFLTTTMAIGIGVGFVSALYISYLTIVNLGMGGSVYAALTGDEKEAAPAT